MSSGKEVNISGFNLKLHVSAKICTVVTTVKIIIPKRNVKNVFGVFDKLEHLIKV